MRKLLLLLALFPLSAFAQQINPATQINWPLVTGTAAPTASCTSTNYGQPYLDLSTFVQYLCGTSGWSQISTLFQHNGTNLADQNLLNFNDTTPAAPSGSTNVLWQSDANGDISASYITPGCTTANCVITNSSETQSISNPIAVNSNSGTTEAVKSVNTGSSSTYVATTFGICPNITTANIYGCTMQVGTTDSYIDSGTNAGLAYINNGSVPANRGSLFMGMPGTTYPAFEWDVYGNSYFPQLLGAPCLSTSGSGELESNCPGIDNILSYGAIADERDVTGCSTTAGSATLTCPAGTFSASDNNRTFLVPMGTAGVLTATYTSGITATGSAGQTCDLSNFNMGGTGASGVVYLTGTNTIAAGTQIYTFPNKGSGYSSAPTTATAANGTATCSGTASISSSLLPAAIVTTATYVSSTTATMGTDAVTSGTSLVVSIGTDNSAAIQNWVNACESSHALCYAPAGQYMYLTPPTISSYLNMAGSGEQANLGSSTETGYTWVLPSFPPYITGTVFVMATPTANAIVLSPNGQSINMRDFGIRFAPSIAFNNTGDGIYTSGNPHGPNYSDFSDVAVWGTDGSHYGFYLPFSGTNQFTYDQQWGGGGFYLYSNSNSVLTNIITAMVSEGSSTGILLNNGANYITMVRPQAQSYNPIAGGSAANFADLYLPPFPADTQIVFDSDSSIEDVAVINPDFEGGGSYYSSSSSFTMLGDQRMLARGGNSEIQQQNNGDLSIGTGIVTPAMLELGSGTWEAIGLLPTLSGCAFSGEEGGASAGQFTAGSTSCAVTATLVGNAKNGAICKFTDLTTPADTFVQTASTTSYCTVNGTVAVNDVIQYEILAY